MTRVWFVVPVHEREALTRVCLRQLRRTCDAMSAYEIDASAVVIGDDANLEFAYQLGFAIVQRDNAYLGRRFNDGYQLACDPDYNSRPADYVVPCGSDDWVDPQIFQHLPPTNTIGTFRKMAVVNERRDRLQRISVGYKGGVGIRIVPAALLAKAGYRPADEDRKRAIDTSTLMGLVSANDRNMPRMVALDVHPLQIVDWKSRGAQLNSYAMLRGYRRGDESTDPFGELAEHYPAEALDEMRALSSTLVPA